MLKLNPLPRGTVIADSHANLFIVWSVTLGIVHCLPAFAPGWANGQYVVDVQAGQSLGGRPFGIGQLFAVDAATRRHFAMSRALRVLSVLLPESVAALELSQIKQQRDIDDTRVKENLSALRRNDERERARVFESAT
jgi:hypothetical protein